METTKAKIGTEVEVEARAYLRQIEVISQSGDFEAAGRLPAAVQVRNGWHRIGQLTQDGEYEIWLAISSPHTVRIHGETVCGEPTSAVISYHGLNQPWCDMQLTEWEREALLRFVSLVLDYEDRRTL